MRGFSVFDWPGATDYFEPVKPPTLVVLLNRPPRVMLKPSGNLSGDATVGDVQIGQIYNMDCVKGMGLLPEECVNLVITDPPFAIDFKAKRTNYNRP